MDNELSLRVWKSFQKEIGKETKTRKRSYPESPWSSLLKEIEQNKIHTFEYDSYYGWVGVTLLYFYMYILSFNCCITILGNNNS